MNAFKKYYHAGGRHLSIYIESEECWDGEVYQYMDIIKFMCFNQCLPAIFAEHVKIHRITNRIPQAIQVLAKLRSVKHMKDCTKCGGKGFVKESYRKFKFEEGK